MDANGELLVQAQEILDNINILNVNIEGLQTYGRTNRRFIRWLTISLLFDVALSFGLGAVAFRSIDAAHKAQAATSTARLNATNQHETCLAGNEGRKATRDLWYYVLDIPPTNPLTAAQQKQRADFRVYVDTSFAARDCDVVAPVPRK